MCNVLAFYLQMALACLAMVTASEMLKSSGIQLFIERRS
jgi:hypothetical protein